tara:strand:- start:59 stop:1438 length:1380 start_codon:yes stop_codon:yes gene_type:complete
MKKLLVIVVLGLLCCSFSTAGEMNLWNKTVKLPDDVSKGYKKGWSFGNNYDPETHLTPDYAFTIVNKSDGHPVRFGEKSIRFELRKGDCGTDSGGYNDCTVWNEKTGHYSERHELGSNDKFPSKGVTWHTFSFFLPEDFPIVGHYYEHISLGQFHGGPNNNPNFKWDVDEETYQLRRRTGCFLKEFIKKSGEKNSFNCSIGMPENNRQDVISKQDLRGKWHDIVINVKWSRKQDGYFKQWINGKLVYHYMGNTSKPKGSTNNFKFGIYRGATKKTPKDSVQIAYYDEIRYAKKSCKKLNLQELGYSCEKLISQKISNAFIDHIPGKIKLEIKSLDSLDGKYTLSWYWVNRNVEDNSIINQKKVLEDKVTIKNGKLSFDEMAKSEIISNKYRKKIGFLNIGDKFMIMGSLDLDTSKPQKVTITGSTKLHEYGYYLGEGLFGYDNSKNRNENIKVTLTPIK